MGVECHAIHPIAAHKHQVRTKLSQKALFSKGWDVPVPGQGRLTLKGARRPYQPDFDRLVPAAASDEFAISTEADRIDPVLEISQQVQDEGMNSSNTEVMNSPVGVPGHGVTLLGPFITVHTLSLIHI